MEGHGSTLADFLNSTGNAAKAGVDYVAHLAKGAKEKVEHSSNKAKAYVAKKLYPQPAGAPIELCAKNRKAERVAERKAKLAGSKERLKAMPPGKQRDALAHATERFERNNVAVERARLANDTYNVGQGDPPEGWERVGPVELRKMGMTEDTFPQLASDFRPSEYKDGYYPELYRTTADVFGEERNVLCFRGTQGIKDGAADAIQAFGGETDQYTRAIRTAQKLKTILGDKLDLAGHSMGGGMATAAGIVTGSSVYAIDPAGVHPATLERVGRQYTRDSAKRYVQNYVAEGEILDTVQDPHSQRLLLAGIVSVSPTGGTALAIAGHRAMAENATVTYGAAGPIYKLPIITNAKDVLDGKTKQGMYPGLGGRVANRLNPLQKIHLHDVNYIVAGIEQQKADDVCVMDKNLGAQ